MAWRSRRENPLHATPWAPLLLTGRWLYDEWGGGWLQVEEWTVAEPRL
ncbi:MAG: hypothetical protein R3E79_12020 [Caldilineaceae bacterium]